MSAVSRLAAQVARLARRARAGIATAPNPKLAAAEDFDFRKSKAMLLSGLFAALVGTGAVWGASLRTKQQVTEEKKKVQNATFEETLAALEQRRSHLSRQKTELEIKIADVRARRTGTAPAEQEDGPERLRARELFGK